MIESIKKHITLLPEYTDDHLVHMFKVISSKQTAADKKLYAPLKLAIEKERKKRGTATTISSKIVQPSAKKTNIADDYEGVENDY